MKYVLKHTDNIFGMTNLVPRKTGMAVDIWLDNKGILRKVRHNVPRVKIGTNEEYVSVSISRGPEILSMSGNIKHSTMAKIKQALKYVSKNSDLFLKHYNDTDDTFYDEDLFGELRKRGQIR